MDNRQWFTTSQILTKHHDLQITQVYCWIYTLDQKIVLVSKDNIHWQFPGGHPKDSESLVETCLREVLEETGINLAEYSESIKMFGYYIRSTESHQPYLQTRYFINLNKDSYDLELTPQEPDADEESSKINFVSTFTLDEACQRILWLNDSVELKTFLSIV